MSKAKELMIETIEDLKSIDALSEQKSPGNDVFLPLIQPMSNETVGAMQVFQGEMISKLVYVSLAIPPAGIDSHMVFAFTSKDSPIPHFTLDSVSLPGHLAFHLDLIPKVDLGANLNYMKACYQPLLEHFKKANDIKGFTPAHLSPYQNAVMSPFMLANRSTEEAFDQLGPIVKSYLHHFGKILRQGLGQPTMDDIKGLNMAKRDQANRDILFSKEIDPVWNQIEGFIGAETGSAMRKVLRNLDPEQI